MVTSKFAKNGIDEKKYQEMVNSSVADPRCHAHP
jgi:hypothetical protein